MMNAVMIVTGGGAMVILTSHSSVTEPALLEKLAHKGVDKFIAFELGLDLAKARYGGHYFVVARDLREADDLRVLDYNGERAFRLFSFAEFGPPIMHEGGGEREAAA
ncbi:MAG: hypothetical protein RBS99_13645 [Rhodospirillales bacterium]|jgi:hypothetical protein|nr:hypothetical protein [Rhodospirillales bacterium]